MKRKNIIFKDGIDFYWSRSRVLEKLNSLPAGTLSQGVQPALGPDATALGQIFWHTLEGQDKDGNPTGGWDLDELRSIQDWYVRIQRPDDIWDAIVKAAQVPGSTSAPKLQPIAARIVMLQSGMRAPMGIKIKGPDLQTIERVGLQLEKYLKQVPSVEPSAVIADRIVGKPYLEINIDRNAIARYGIKLGQVQEVIKVGIKSEDTFLIGYVLFDMKSSCFSMRAWGRESANRFAQNTLKRELQRLKTH